MVETNVPSESKERLNPRSITVCTPTLYKNWQPDGNLELNSDSVRGNIALRTFKLTIDAGYQVVVVDGGSNPLYLEELKKLGVTIQPQKGSTMSSAKRECLKTASELPDCKVLVFIQPEKDAAIANIPQIVLPIMRDHADIVIPARNLQLFEKTCSSVQFKSEKLANRWCNRISHLLGILPKSEELDWFFGIKVLKNDPEIVDLFMKRYEISDTQLVEEKFTDPERYSDVDFYPVIEALKSGKKVVSVEIPFEYPASQKEIEEKLNDQFADKRRRQKISILAEFIQYARFMTNNPRSKLIKIMEKEANQLAND
ncbi:MAG: hypothetical protein HYW86_04100 [Candidatus Roizmanbacteria bacterium]|nr:MAG: hypothetical protein HYW86_04100 [Candidatus Roizmanbacteria bacterium]